MAEAPIKSSVYRGLPGAITNVPIDLPSTLKPREVLLKITHASLCGSDVHMFGQGCALGHEGVGIVEKIGSEVTQFKVGDRAGAGYLRDVRTFLNDFLFPFVNRDYRLKREPRLVAIAHTA